MATVVSIKYQDRMVPTDRNGTKQAHLSFGDLLQLALGPQVMEALKLFVRDPTIRHNRKLNRMSFLTGGLDDQVLI